MFTTALDNNILNTCSVLLYKLLDINNEKNSYAISHSVKTYEEITTNSRKYYINFFLNNYQVNIKFPVKICNDDKFNLFLEFQHYAYNSHIIKEG